MQRSIEMDREEFRTWLATREPDEKVYDESNCPIGHWLADKLDKDVWQVRVGYKKLTFLDDFFISDIPMWGTLFIYKVDSVLNDKRPDDEDSFSLSAKEVLGVLDDLANE